MKKFLAAFSMPFIIASATIASAAVCYAQTDVQTDELTGPVRTAIFESAEFDTDGPTPVEAKKVLNQANIYDIQGRKVDEQRPSSGGGDYGFMYGEEPKPVKFTFNFDANFVKELLSYKGDSLESKWTYEWDEKGNLLEKTSGDTKVVYEYNALGQMVKETETNTDLETESSYDYNYDDHGSLVERPGMKCKYTYDSKGRVVEVTRYLYDGSVDSVSRYIFDAKDRLSEEQYDRDTDKYRWVYTYDNAGNITVKMNYLNGAFTQKNSFVYDAQGFMTGEAVYDAKGNLSTKYAYKYVVDAQKNWTKRTTYEYDDGKFTPSYSDYRTLTYYTVK